MPSCTCDTLAAELSAALDTLPMLDAHTHLVAGRLGASGLHDILLYHMVISDLYAAGCPSGARLTPFPGRPEQVEAHQRLREAVPYLPAIQNTSCSWGLRVILHDLYGWDEKITLENWERLDAIIRERAGDVPWQREIVRRARIRRLVTEWARRGAGEDRDLLQYSLEWAFFTRCQWGEYDTALYELERCWGESPDSPTPIGAGLRAPTARVVATVDDVHAAIAHYVQALPYGQVLSLATHISVDLDLRAVTEGEMAAALLCRDCAGPRERDIYASYINEAVLAALESRAERPLFQFSYAAEPLPYETGSRVSQRSLAQVAEMIGRHPGIRFQCHVASRHANQSLCTIARELPNLSLAGYWWHNFFPGAIRQVMEERLDMLPVNKQVGFFSDAYCLEWTYAKARIVRNQLASVLAQKVRQGQYRFDDAVAIASAILFDAPQELCGLEPGPA